MSTALRDWRMALVVVWVMALHWTYSTAWPRPYDDWKNLLFYAGAGVIGLWTVAAKSRSRSFLIGIPHLLFILYLGVAALSLTNPQAPVYEGLLAIGRLVLWGCVAWGASQLQPAQMRTLAVWSVLSGVVMAGVHAAAVHGLIAFPSHAIMPPVGHVSYVGDFFALLLPLTWFLISTTRSRRAFAAWTAASLILFLGLWNSGTRASFVGLCAGVLLLVCVSWRRPRRRLLMRVIPSLLGLVLLCGVLTNQRAEGVRGNPMSRMPAVAKVVASPTGALRTRWGLIQNSWAMSTERPVLGHGIGSFRFLYYRYAHRRGHDPSTSVSTWMMHPHNEIVHHLAEVGWAGLLTVTSLLFSLLWMGMRRRDDPKEGLYNGSMVMFGMGGLGIALVVWQFDTAFLHPLMRGAVALYLGMVWAGVRSLSRTIAVVPMRRVVCGGGVAMIAAATLLVTAYNVSLYYVQLARRSVHRTHAIARMALLAPSAYDSQRLLAAQELHEVHGSASEFPYVDRFVASFPSAPVPLYYAARAALRLDDVPEARRLLERALAADPGFRKARGLLEWMDARALPSSRD